jgi:tRNA1Val (adenine37-N6)-methyltransferase
MTRSTRDTIAIRGAGVVRIEQPAQGARFTLDSLLLADFCRLRPRDKVLEPGAGTGVITLLLAKKHPAARFLAIENEPHAFDLLCRNIETNDLANRITAANQDIGRLPNIEVFDAVVANPPYTKAGAGRTSPSAPRRQARHDQSAPLKAWIDLGSLLKNKGKFFLVFTAARAAEVISLLREYRLEPKRIRFVHPSLGKPAALILIEAVAAAAPNLEILPPLIVHGPGNVYSEEMKKIYNL